MVDEVIEARDYVTQLISKGWFRHAVGERGVRYIVELLRFVDLNYRECSVNLDLNFLMNLLDDYYNTESRIRYFIREIMRIQGYDSVARQLINAYPVLPPDLREFLDSVAKSLPSDATPGTLIEQAVKELLKGLEDFRERLISIVNIAKSQCPKAYNQTS